MSRNSLIAALCTVAALAPLTAAAEDNRFYASTMAQLLMFDDGKPFESDVGFHFGLGMPFNEKLVFELNYLKRGVDLRPAGSVVQDGLGLDMLVFFDGRDGAFDPYVLFGYGQLSDDYGTSTDDYGSAQIALGVVDNITDDLAFRGEIRVYSNDDIADGTDIALGVGLMYRFGAKPALKAAPMAAPAPAPAPAPAAAAAPTPVPVAAVAAVPVVAAVVDSDSDGDGVLDSADKCPGTPAGTAVLANGCEVPKVVKLEGVTFTSGTANFVAGATAKLDLAVQALKDNPTIAVEVAGHTDAQGDAELNRKLSQQRADAVRKYLLDGGVAATQVSAKGYGEDEPSASNDTADGRALNRRVELRVKQ